MFTRQFSLELDRIRWIAALLVVIEHARNLLFVDFRYVAEQNILLKMFYFFSGLGHQAVIVFFVLSGLLVGGTTLRKFREGRFDFGDYAVHRFSRIYIVLIPALAAGWMLDMAGILHFNDSGLYTHGEQYGIVRVFANQMDWATVLGNALNLQRIVVPNVGSNGALWSLAHEWWYYCMFALILGAVAAGNRPLRFLLVAVLIAMLVALPPFVSAWFVIWLAGISVGLLPLGGLKINRWFAYALFFGVLLWSRFDTVISADRDIVDNFLRDLALAGGCVVLFTALAQDQGKAGPQRIPHRIHAALADFSYTLYLVHLPFLVLTAAVLNDVFGIRFYRQPTAAGFLYFVLIIGFAYVYGYLFSRMTEAHTARLRRWLRRPRAAQATAQSGG